MFHTWTNVRRTFKGLIDDFRVYKKAFSSSEVQALFGNGNGDGINSPAPVHYTIAGSESPDNFTATNLPSGLSVNAKTGKITGITTAVGDYNATIRAGNFLGFSPQQILKISVKAIAPQFSQSSDDLTASNVLGTSASINFKIDDFGGQDANVTVYFDSTDKGTNAANWLNTQAGSSNLGTGSHNISLTGLTLGATYHFRVAGQNSGGVGWTNLAGTFTTSSSTSRTTTWNTTKSTGTSWTTYWNTSQNTTITNENGEFAILARVNDEIIFSSVQYIIRTVRVSEEVMKNKRLIVQINQRVRELDEVVITPDDTQKFLDLKQEQFKGFDYLDDKSTRIQNILTDDRQIVNGLNFVNIFKLLSSLVDSKSEEEKINISPSEVLPYILDDNFFSDILNLEPYETSDFLYKLDSDQKLKNLILEKNQFLVIDYLLKEVEIYKSLQVE